jgi:hypothetical protein
MPNFHIKLDNKFDEFIAKLNEKKILTINDLIKLKSFIIDAYHDENKEDNEYIRLSLNLIDFKI